MKTKLSLTLAAVFMLLGQSTLFASGIGFDPDSDGTDEIKFHPDGAIESMNNQERISSQYGEYIDFNDKGDNNVCVGSQGSDNKSVCVNFQDDNPALVSSSETLAVNGNMRVWLPKGEPTTLTLQSDGNQKARLAFNEYTTTRGEIYSEGRDNSFHINSLHPSGLALNSDSRFDVKIASGGGNTAVGHKNPDTTLDIDGAVTIRQRSSEPPNPDDGSAVIWMSNGSGVGKKGDIMVKITSNNVTRLKTLVSF